MYCTACGTALMSGAQFCSHCGHTVKKKDHHAPLPLLIALAVAGVALVLVFLGLSAISGQNTPKATVDKLMAAFAHRDRAAVVACFASGDARDLAIDWMEDADGSAALLYRLTSTHDGENDPEDTARLLDGFSALEVVTVATDWSRAYSNAQTLSVLLRVTPHGGRSAYTLSLTELDFTYQNGNWYLK